MQSNSAHFFISLAAIFAVQAGTAAPGNSTTKPATANYVRPISFEPNRGQTDKQVDFLAHGAGYSMFLSHAEAVMVLRRNDPPKAGLQSRPMPADSAVVGMKPIGGNASAKVEALGELPGESNYLIGNVPERWHRGIPNYSKVRYLDVYPGVNMIYYGNQSQLDYDFAVTPGADPSTISLFFQGPSKAELDSAGNVLMNTPAGEVRWHKPVAYQDVNGIRKAIRCTYVPKGPERVGFRLGVYDRTKPLIIDPQLDYSTYLGGSNGDSGLGIAVDANGNAYVTGTAGSDDFPIKNAFQSNNFGNAFITKFDASGNLVYSTFLGGHGGDYGISIAVDAKGHAYVTGFTASFDFPTKNPFQKALKNQLGNAFVTKLATDGDALVYSTFLGGSGNSNVGGADVANGIAVDAHDNAYVVGETFSKDFPTRNAFQAHFKGGYENAFVTKLCPAGNSLMYSTYLGGSVQDQGNAIAVDSHGIAYVTGGTDSPDFPTKNAFQENLHSPDGNVFVTKLCPAGNALVYSTFLGGSSRGVIIGDSGWGIAVDAQGNVYVAGETFSKDFPTKNAIQKELKGFQSAFVTKFNAVGNALVYSTFLEGTGTAFASGIAVDTYSNAYVTGFTDSTDFPIKNALQKNLKSQFGDAFVTKFCPVGTLIYSTYLGGSGNLDPDIGGGDSGASIAVDAEGNAYVTGSTLSLDFPTKNAFQPMLGGPNAENAFVTRISAK